MEQQKSYDPDRTVTINSGRGPAAGFVLGVLGFLVALVAVLGVGIVSLDTVADDHGSTSSVQQDRDADSH